MASMPTVSSNWRSLAVAMLAALLCLTACVRNDPDGELSAAKELYRQGQRNAAVLKLKSSLQESPEHAESRLYLGSLYVESGDYSSAEKELRRALDLKIEPSRVYPALARALLMQGQPKKALEDVPVAEVSAPDALAELWAVRAMAHAALKQFDEAKAALDKSLAAKPGNAEALLGYARLQAADRKFQDALSSVDRAIAADPKHPDARMLKGDLLRVLGRSDEARAAYQDLIKLKPDHVAALLALVSFSISGGKLDEAGQYLEAARKASPSNPMVTYFKALIAFRKSDFKTARDSIGAVLKVAPNHLPSVLLGGAVEFALGSQELAQVRLKYVLDRAPNNVYARRLLTASYSRAGQTHKALELLEPVLKAGSQDPTLLALAGEIYMQLNEPDKARQFFEQASKLDPKNPAMRTGLGLSRLASGDLDEATADLATAAQLDSSRHHADVLLISTYLQRQQFDQAMKAAQAFVSKQPDNPISHNLLAAAYIGKKDFAAARKSLEKALQIQPLYTPAAANLAQLDLKDGDKKAARKRFEDIIAKDKSHVQAYISLAALGPRIDASKDEIRGWLEAARKESPDTIQPLVMLARFYLQSNEPKKALEVVEKALVSAPDNPEVLDLAGQVQLASGEKNRALATFSKWVTVQPSAMSSFRMAVAQLANEDTSGAIASLRKAIEYRPQFPEAQVLLAETYSKTGKAGEALKVASTLQQQSPKTAVGWMVEGDVHMREKQYAEAVKAYEKAVSTAPSGIGLVKLHGALTGVGKPSLGEARLKEWLRSNPSDSATRMYLAEAYLNGEKFKDAVVEYEFLRQALPENVVVLNNLAWSYHQLKDDRAIGIAEQALKRQPDSPPVLDTLGWIMVEMGDVKKGTELLRKAVDVAPRSPEIRLHYARALAKTGATEAAKNQLERFLLDFPQHSEAASAQKLLKSLRS